MTRISLLCWHVYGVGFMNEFSLSTPNRENVHIHFYQAVVVSHHSQQAKTLPIESCYFIGLLGIPRSTNHA